MTVTRRSLLDIALTVLCTVIYLLTAGYAGAKPLLLVLAAVYIWLGVWLPGAAAADAMRAQRWGLRTTSALTIGGTLFAGLAIAASALGAFWLMWLLPLAGLWQLVQRRGQLCRVSWRIPQGMLLAGTLLLIVGTVLPHMHPEAAGAILPDHDFYWNLGNVQSFLQGFPPRDLRWQGGVLTYHWLTELYTAGIVMATGASAYDMAAFFVPALALAALLAAVREFAKLWLAPLSRLTWWVFLEIIMYGGCAGLWKIYERGTSPFGNLFLRHLITNINGVCTGMLFLCAFSSCLLAIWQKGAGGSVYCTAGAAFVLLTLAKGPVAAIVSVALLCAACAQLLLHRHQAQPQWKAWQLLGFSLVLCAVFGLLYLLLFAKGAQSSVHLEPDGTLLRGYFGNMLNGFKVQAPRLYPFVVPLFWLAHGVLFAPFGAAGALLGGWALWRRRRLPDFPWLFAFAMICGGFLAFFLFEHEAYSQMYFAFAGLWFLHTAAVKSVRAARQSGARVLCLPAAAAFCISLWSGMFTVMWLAQQAFWPADSGRDLPVTAAEEQAMAFVQRTFDQGALLVTNRIHTGKALEGLSNVYSGLSGRQFYMEGFKYAMSNLGVGIDEALMRIEQLRSLFLAQTPQQVLERVPKGTDAIVYSRRAARRGWDVLEGEHSPAEQWARQGLEVLLENEDVIIYAVSPVQSEHSDGG